MTKLGSNSKKMILMKTFYDIFKSFVLIFVNIYLWKTGKDIKVVAIFNIFNYIGATVSFYIGNMIARKNMKLNYLFSSLSFIMLFAITLIFGDKVSQFAIFMGIFGGFGDGLFFFNLNNFQASYLDRDEIDTFMSVMGIAKKITSIITPLISGIIIELYGYNTMTYALIILVIVQFITGFSLPNTKINGMMKFNFETIKKEKSYRNLLLTHTIRAPFSQITTLSNSVFLFYFIQSEKLMGNLNSIFSVTSIVLFYLYLVLQKKFDRSKLMYFGAISHSLAVLLLIKPSFTTFVIYSLAITIGTTFFANALTGLQIHCAKRYSNSQMEMIGNLMLRVILLNIGRCTFFLLMYFFYTGFDSLFFKLLLAYNFVIPVLCYNLAKEDI